MTSKQIAYCSLEEAWNVSPHCRVNPEYQSLLKPALPNEFDSAKPTQPETDFRLRDRAITQYQSQLNQLQTQSQSQTHSPCYKFYEHFIECEACKNKIERFLTKNRNENMIEGFTNQRSGTAMTLDIFVLIIIGIFLIFILDCFVRLGKNMK